MDPILQIPPRDLKMLVDHLIKDKHYIVGIVLNEMFKVILHMKADLDLHSHIVKVLQLLLLDDRVNLMITIIQ